MDVSCNENTSQPNGSYALDETEECGLAKILDRRRPPTLLENRQRSLDEKSLSEFAQGVPSRLSRNPDSISRLAYHLENSFPPDRRSSSPRSGPSTPSSCVSHPMAGEAWEALRRSLVYFRGQPVGTIAALDNSEEKLNYDQACISYSRGVLAIAFITLTVFTSIGLCEGFCSQCIGFFDEWGT